MAELIADMLAGTASTIRVRLSRIDWHGWSRRNAPRRRRAGAGLRAPRSVTYRIRRCPKANRRPCSRPVPR
jgi:hypothetical protein